MGTIQFTLIGGPLVSSASAVCRTGTGQRADLVRFRFDQTYRLIFSVDDVDVALAINGNSFGAVERRQLRRSTIATVTLRPRSSDMLPNGAIEVDSPDAMSFAEGDPHRTSADEQGSWAQYWLVLERLSGLGESFFAGPCDGRDCALSQIDASNAVIADVGDVEKTLVVQGDTVGTV